MNNKQYILVFSLIITFFTGAAFVADYFFRAIPNVYQFKYDKIKRDSENYNTIILGSSHSYFGVNPDYFEQPTLNLANVSQDLKYDKYILEKSISNLKGIKTVILPISYFSLFSELETGVEYWRKYFYVLWFGYPPENRLDIGNYSALVSYPSKTWLLGLAIHYYLKNDFKPSWSGSGWGMDYSDSSSEPLLNGEKSAKRHEGSDLYYAKNSTVFNDIVDICVKNNITLLLTTLPAHISYRRYLSESRLHQIDSLLHKTATMNKNVLYVNFLSDQRFLDEDFHDVDHLNHTGAKKLSSLINKLLNTQAISDNAFLPQLIASP